jgi:outer membrane receptor protein involved in Fe transport
MKKRAIRRTLAIITTLPLGAAFSQAQTSPAVATPATDDATEADVVVLDPFTVTTEHEGYQAVDTLAGGRVRTELKDTAASLSVVTSKLMQDLGVTNAEELLVYTNNTEVAGLGGNFSGLSNRGTGVSLDGPAEGKRLANPGGVNRARGLTGMDSTRNYFLSDIPWDGYNISRVDISRGPNSFLFGVGSPSGISNVSTNDAMFTDKGSIEVHYGSFGSTRESLDYNKVLIPDQLAMRVDLVNDNRYYRQDPAFNHSMRAYGALRFDPKFLRTDSAHTKITASFEHGRVRSNNPRTLPPIDYITGYLNDPQASATGYNPWTYTQDGATGMDHSQSLWASAGSVSNQYQFGGSPQFYYDGTNGVLLGAGESSFRMGPGTHPNTWNVHSSGYSGHARAMNYIATHVNGLSEADAPYQGSYMGTVSYYDQTLTDPSIFDFYNKLIDGDNKREWQDWDAYNVSVVQSLFKERLTVQAVYDHQEYSTGNKGLLNNRTPLLLLDLNSYQLAGNPTWLGGETVNPNVGRPVLFADQGKYEQTDIDRNNYQVTAAYDLNFERDFSSKGLWARILGRHQFTGLWSRSERFSVQRSYNLNGVDYSYRIATGDTAARLRDNGYNWLAYMGPSMLGTTGTGANLDYLSTLTLPSSVEYRIFDKTWTAGSSVLPTDPWTFTGENGASVTLTQVDNPANYRGYVRTVFPSISRGDPVLATGGHTGEQIITSKAVMYQGHFWDDTIVPSVGYREDTTRQRGGDPVSGQGIVDLNYDLTPAQSATTNSTSYGVALHLPKAIKKRLPEGTDLSFYYFRGQNETPKIRYGLDGLPLANESGKTDDYAVQFDGLNGHLTARLTYFKTKNENSSASVGQPLATWLVQGLPTITLQYAAWALAERQLGIDPATNQVIGAPASWGEWQVKRWWTPHSWMYSDPAAADRFEQAMKTSFAEQYPQSYWDAWGFSIDVDAIKRGDWLHVNRAWDNPQDIGRFGGSSTIGGEYPTIDQNLESKGYELEITIRPVKNWDITFNGSKVDATQTGYGVGATKVLTGMADLYLGTPVGYANIWGGFETAKQMFLGDVWSKYLAQIALIGSVQPEMRKYHFNVISNYSFSTGILKGFNTGGAYRWQDKAVSSYHIHETEIYGQTAWIANVNDPIYSPSEGHVDLWFGYERPLTDKVKWRVQLNLRNVGESKGLVPITYQPDGTVAQSRIQEGMTYDLSMRFMF